MAEQMSPPSYELAAAQSMCCKVERCRARPGSCPAEVPFHWSRYSARGVLTAAGFTEAQQLMPVGALAVVPVDLLEHVLQDAEASTEAEHPAEARASHPEIARRHARDMAPIRAIRALMPARTGSEG